MSPVQRGAADAARLKVRADDGGGEAPAAEGAEGKHTDWRKYHGQYGSRHDSVLRTMAEHPDGLTAAEAAALLGVHRTSARNYLTELCDLGLAKFDGVRKEGRAHVLVAFLTELGAEKARWLLSDPVPYGTRAQEGGGRGQ